MQTIKTALLVVFMMVILYGAYVILYTTDAPPDGVTQLLKAPVAAPQNPVSGDVAAGNTDSPLSLDSEPPAALIAEAPQNETPAQQLQDDIVLPEGENDLADAASSLPLDAGLPTALSPGLRPLDNDASASGDDTSDTTGPLDTRDSAFPAAVTSPPPVTNAPPLQQAPEPSDADMVSFRRAWEVAKNQIESGQLREGLLTLSVYHGNDNLPAEYQRQLVEILDYLAGEVIYSQRHMIEPPYTVRPGESLQAIAHQFRVPVRLLQNINGIRDPGTVIAGSQLKVVRGPFRAVVDISEQEVTLFAGQYYSGRFSCRVGADPSPEPGEYSVLAKQQNRSYHVGDGSILAGGDQANPYGRFWMDLGNNVCLHGSSSNPAVNQARLGCIGLGAVDAADVYGILTAGSPVRVQR